MKFDASIVKTTFQSPLGLITVAATDRGLAGLWFEGQQHLPHALAKSGSPAEPWPDDPVHPVLLEVRRQLARYFAGTPTSFDMALDLSGGTDFQQAVWAALRSIPAGSTASYGELSRRIGKPAAVRAVGAAIGRNPVSIVVPCHRVIGAGGALTGYAGGLQRKTALLELEGAFPPPLH